MFRAVIPLPRDVTRIVQPAGHAVRAALTYRDGFAVRLPGRRLLLVVWRHP